MGNATSDKPRRIHVIVNPSAGRPKPVLHVLHNVFAAAGAEWDVVVTHKPGDARLFAADAASQRADVVAVYGGDDTVLDVAAGLMGTRVPMAILPGGSANSRAKEFGVPLRLDVAARIACDPNSRTVAFDVGMCQTSFFMRHVQIGLSTEQLEAASNEMSDKKGRFAYAFATLKALHDSRTARFRLTLDGQPVECDGVLCHIANTQATGELGHMLTPDATASDGLLDIVVVKASDFSSMNATLESGKRTLPEAAHIHYWRAREVHVATSRPLPAQCDGAACGSTPVRVSVVRQAVRILIKG